MVSDPTIVVCVRCGAEIDTTKTLAWRVLRNSANPLLIQRICWDQYQCAERQKGQGHGVQN